MRHVIPLLSLLLLAGCGPSAAPVFQGYVEGEFIDVASEVDGRIVELAVERGDEVAADAVLFRVDDAEASAAVKQAEAELARAEAELANLLQGQRPPEIAVIDAQIAEAQAALDKAERDLDRQQVLFDRRVISAAQLDQAQEAITVAAARVTAAERQKDVAAMPARTPQIDAGERAVDAASAMLEQARTRLGKHSVQSPAAGRIEDVYRELGEVASIAGPVLSLLPSGSRKAVFFVAEPDRAALSEGAAVGIACDGCPGGLTAEITFLGREAEFTPPVIFSRENRAKLMFRAEAKLSGEAAALPLGQPVDVTPAARAGQ